MFQFTRPAWGATHLMLSRSSRGTVFQFTRPAWGATPSAVRAVDLATFQFTRPAWGATAERGWRGKGHLVSIHAPRVGRDNTRSNPIESSEFQFTRPAWGATVAELAESISPWFQFTRPAWGATCSGVMSARAASGFNSRAPRGARPAG